jgi:hypothetical protein
LERTDADTKRWQREHNIPPDDPEPFGRIARAVVNVAGSCRERLFLLADAEDTLVEPSHATQVVESFGGEIVAGPEFSTQGGLGGLFNCTIFTTKRRSITPIREYLAKHASTPIG